jgi:hypothetical protein
MFGGPFCAVMGALSVSGTTVTNGATHVTGAFLAAKLDHNGSD